MICDFAKRLKLPAIERKPIINFTAQFEIFIVAYFEASVLSIMPSADRHHDYLPRVILAYNTMILEQVYQGLIKKVGEARAKAIMSKISPVSWGHIIFTGRYYLRGPQKGIDIEKLVKFLAEKLDETL